MAKVPEVARPMPARPAPKSIALSMIVKNERHVITRCLDSVRPLITTWVIVDTGSTDGTQDVIRSALADLPGELHERPWRDFGHNRTEALELARGKADYVLVIDADDRIVVPAGFELPALSADGYKLRIEYAGTVFWRPHLFRADLDYRYAGVLHEALVSDHPRSEEKLEGLVYLCATEGSRSSDPDKYRKDAAVLEAALEGDPANARYAFYLAQSWRDAGEHLKALAAYEMRAQMSGWEEETWYARLEVARTHARLGHTDDVVTAAYLRAFERRPTRAEPLCYLAQLLRERGRIIAAYPFARAASEIARPGDVLFIDDAVYAWRATDEYAVSAYWMGYFADALAANERLLAGGALPPSERARVEQNADFCRRGIAGAVGDGAR
jgi:glycosyltransferase involved in cell wall biosynthesis